MQQVHSNPINQPPSQSSPTTCSQQANQYPIFAQPSPIHPSFSSIPPPQARNDAALAGTTSFTSGEPWLNRPANDPMTLSSTISNLQLSSPTLQPPQPHSHSHRPQAQETHADNAFEEEYGDEVCFLVDNFHVKENDSSFMPYIM